MIAHRRPIMVSPEGPGQIRAAYFGAWHARRLQKTVKRLETYGIVCTVSHESAERAIRWARAADFHDVDVVIIGREALSHTAVDALKNAAKDHGVPFIHGGISIGQTIDNLRGAGFISDAEILATDNDSLSKDDQNAAVLGTMADAFKRHASNIEAQKVEVEAANERKREKPNQVTAAPRIGAKDPEMAKGKKQKAAESKAAKYWLTVDTNDRPRVRLKTGVPHLWSQPMFVADVVYASVDEAAKANGRHRSSAYQWIKDGRTQKGDVAGIPTLAQCGSIKGGVEFTDDRLAHGKPTVVPSTRKSGKTGRAPAKKKAPPIANTGNRYGAEPQPEPTKGDLRGRFLLKVDDGVIRLKRASGNPRGGWTIPVLYRERVFVSNRALADALGMKDQSIIGRSLREGRDFKGRPIGLPTRAEIEAIYKCQAEPGSEKPAKAKKAEPPPRATPRLKPRRAAEPSAANPPNGANGHAVESNGHAFKAETIDLGYGGSMVILKLVSPQNLIFQKPDDVPEELRSLTDWSAVS